jgi:hypothetical protein
LFRAFRSRNFALLWTGSFAANVGIWMQSVAMGWLGLRMVTLLPSTL